VIVVAADRDGGRDRGQRREDRGRSDVAGVQDEVAPAKRRDRLGSNEAVRVGDDADRHAVAPSIYPAAPGICGTSSWMSYQAAFEAT
jgi:hypothetical protein